MISQATYVYQRLPFPSAYNLPPFFHTFFGIEEQYRERVLVVKSALFA
jgi:hypothetical protein